MMDEPLKIGAVYSTTYGTLWKDGTYLPRGTQVTVVGLHIDQGFCVRFPTEPSDEPLETWEDWSEVNFLAAEGTIEPPSAPLSTAVLAEARDVLLEAEDGCHLHLHDDEV
ncbi:MAG: hypothetical protein JOZ77_04570 [Candidatus Eremiobacteraeota bacterium]|nr:hypothetical protein [Candidatus Eremiobacteraeota bacterium]